MSIVTAADPSV